MPSPGQGRLPLRRGAGRRTAAHIGSRRRRALPWSPPGPGDRIREIVSSAAVILAGVLVVVGFGLVATRAMRSGDEPPAAGPIAPGLGQLTLPSSVPGLIPLESPTPVPSPSATTAAPPTPTPTSEAPDPGAIALVRAGVPDMVDLSAEGTRDWVHWAENGTFAMERDKDGGFAILEGKPTAPRFRHALSPQQFRWTGGDPVGSSDGTPTGIRTCGEGNGFTLTVPAGTATRTLRLYVGVLSAEGRLEARLSAGEATAATTFGQADGNLRTAMLTLTYRAPRASQLRLSWVTAEAYGSGCGGVALQAATLQ